MGKSKFGKMEENTLTQFPNLMRVLHEYGKRAEAYYRDELIKKGKNASFTLLDSVHYQVQHDGRNFEVSLNLEDYWKYIESGRKPGSFPPPSAILSWIKVKPIVPKVDSNGKLPTQKQLAYLIGRKIATEGIEPTPVMKDALTKLNAEMEEAINKAIDQDIESIMTNIVYMLHVK